VTELRIVTELNSGPFTVLFLIRPGVHAGFFGYFSRPGVNAGPITAFGEERA
jgi:hypothetical protein